jgi:hypothetical protein
MRLSGMIIFTRLEPGRSQTQRWVLKICRERHDGRVNPENVHDQARAERSGTPKRSRSETP